MPIAKDKITRDDLRLMKPGESKDFQLPSVAAIDSARVTITQVKRLDNIDFSTVANYVDNILTVYRN